MATFTKDYKATMNKAQKEALERAFKMLVIGELEQGKGVLLVVEDSVVEGSLVASLFSENKLLSSRLIGQRGGLTCLDIE